MIHFARPSRLAGASLGSGGRNAGTAAVTLSPCWSYWPRARMKVSRGFSISCMTIVVGTLLSSSARDVISRASSSPSFLPSGERFER